MIAIHNLEIPYRFPASVHPRSRGGQGGHAQGPRGLARHPADHHRSGRRQGPRRRRLCRARHRSKQPGRPHRLRRHRRRRRLCPARHRARPRGLSARQLGLFPRPRRADAARAHLQRALLAEGRRQPRRRSPCAWSSTPTAARSSHSFHRVLFRSAAKLSYQQAQAAIDGQPDDKTGPLLETILKPLWAAYRRHGARRATSAARSISTCPSARSSSTTKGMVADVRIPERLDAHRLIEEMMIAANVAAAETLEKHKIAAALPRPRLRRAARSCTALRDFLGSLDMPFNKSEAVRPADFNRILGQGPRGRQDRAGLARWCCAARRRPNTRAENYGHFGLNLDRYAHFTSPIRRYADLIVHRALITALDLGNDGLTRRRSRSSCPASPSTSRRPSAAPWLAERETADRLLAQFLADADRRRVRGPHLRRHPLRPLRAPARNRRRWLHPGLDARRRTTTAMSRSSRR